MIDETSLWREADEIFNRLLDIPEVEREPTFSTLSLEPKVREFVTRLLAAHQFATGVLDRPFTEGLATSALSGRRIGHWVLDQEIGRGGSSVVYHAHSCDESLERVAAIKLLTLSALAGPGLQHFQREQQLLSRLHHPHICTLVDAGVADDGTAWFAMTLVEGERIDLWSRHHALGVREVVRLVLTVCEAVAYAHRNLVIHRDLKPSNVLVDTEGHVRLLDFGIARLADATSAEATATQWRALTPEFAAPEQFLGAPPSTAMDVYGLGALLYTVLTGCLPRAGRESADQLPLPPSKAVLHAPSATGLDPRARHRELQGDLDAIVLKAMLPDPELRYGSATELGEDLNRWLDALPVTARSPTTRYRLVKFARRHRLALVAASILVVSLIALVASTFWHNKQVEAAAEQAHAEAERANASRELLLDLFRATGPLEIGGSPPDLLELVARGEANIRDDGALAPAVRVELLTTLGVMYVNQGRSAEGERLLDQAIAIDAAELPSGSVEHSRPRLERLWLLDTTGRTSAAANEARALVADLERTPNVSSLVLAEALQILSKALFTLNARDPEARAIAVRSVEMERTANPLRSIKLAAALANLAQIDRTRGALVESEKAAREAVMLLEQAGPRGRVDLGAAVQTLGITLGALQRRDEALRSLERGVSLSREVHGAKHAIVGRALNNYGIELKVQARYEEALVVFREAGAIENATLRSPERRAASMFNLATLLADLGQFSEATEGMAKSLALLQETLPKADERVLNVMTEFALARQLNGDPTGARDLFNESQRRLASLPADTPLTRTQSAAAIRLARHQLAHGAATSALHWATAARMGFVRASAHNDPWTAECYLLEASALHALDRDGEAAIQYDLAMTILESTDPTAEFAAHRTFLRAARTALDLGRMDAARALLQRSDAARAGKSISRRWVPERDELITTLGALQ